ncbi:MAG: hypothetical protein ACXWUG_11640 [Polyangiales bacterium]
MGDDDARRRILERRAAFVAAALSACAAESCSNPRVCLDVPAEIQADDAVAKPAPPAASSAVPSVKVEEDAGQPKPIPAPCLSPARPRDAGPAPCLKMATDDEW